MKVLREELRESFKPFNLNITIESEIEAKIFYGLFNHVGICDVFNHFGINVGDIREELGEFVFSSESGINQLSLTMDWRRFINMIERK